MTVYRPYLQTNLFNILVGMLGPAGFSWAFVLLIHGHSFSGRIYLLLSFPLFVAGGVYFLFGHCVWKMVCDDEKGILYFYKTFRKVVFRVRELKELNVYMTFRGFDYRFKTATRQITIEELDGMPDLITYIRRANPQVNVTSPEDHTYF